MKDYVRAVLNELTEDQKNAINLSTYEYVIFDVSVFNAGAVIKIQCTDDPVVEDDGYSFFLETDEAIKSLALLK